MGFESQLMLDFFILFFFYIGLYIYIYIERENTTDNYFPIVKLTGRTKIPRGPDVARGLVVADP